MYIKFKNQTIAFSGVISSLEQLGLNQEERNAAQVQYSQHIEEIKSNRKGLYLRKSDPLFMEAIRKDAAGDTEGAEAARAQALQAVADIKAQYPLPENA